MTEFELIYRYFEQLSHSQVESAAPIVKGLGDDAAVISLPATSQWVTCVDTLVQGRHFSEDWTKVNELAFAIGFKAVAVNVSDIAAMGAKPHSILLALALPKRLATEAWLSDFAKGLFHACTQFGVRLIGGDTTRNDKLLISITANGIIAKGASPIYRNGAQVGDKVYVSGTLGDASYALCNPDNEFGKNLAHRLHMPTPRISLGEALSQQGKVTSMIDVSDGLAQDLSHICQQSGVAMRLNLEQLPTSKTLQSVESIERLLCQLTGGDDYELAFTLPADVTVPTVHTQVTCIGEVVELETTQQETSYIHLVYQGTPVTRQSPYPFTEYPNLSGYQHFSKE